MVIDLPYMVLNPKLSNFTVSENIKFLLGL